MDGAPPRRSRPPTRFGSDYAARIAVANTTRCRAPFRWIEYDDPAECVLKTPIAADNQASVLPAGNTATREFQWIVKRRVTCGELLNKWQKILPQRGLSEVMARNRQVVGL